MVIGIFITSSINNYNLKCVTGVSWPHTSKLFIKRSDTGVLGVPLPTKRFFSNQNDSNINFKENFIYINRYIIV